MPQIIPIQLNADTAHEVLPFIKEYSTHIQIMNDEQLHHRIQSNKAKLQGFQTTYDNHPEDSEEANKAKQDYTIIAMLQKICLKEKKTRKYKNALAPTTKHNITGRKRGRRR